MRHKWQAYLKPDLNNKYNSDHNKSLSIQNETVVEVRIDERIPLKLERNKQKMSMYEMAYFNGYEMKIKINIS